MIQHLEITADLTITTLMDLKKLKALEETTNLKLNVSALARKLGVDRWTARKYINGYEPLKTRKRGSQFDKIESTIDKLLDNEMKVFKYKSVLYRYLCENYQLEAPESSFRRYINSVPRFKNYFEQECHAIKKSTGMRFETDKGQQAQVDWKESMDLILKNGEVISVNIFVYLLSYSRFRVYRLSLSKTQDVLFNFMTEAFEVSGGIPRSILFDNMKTVMDKARTEYQKGIINNKFQQFADDMGFEVFPCVAGRPETKAKVESPMKILEELRAYNGDLDYAGLQMKLQEINERENMKFHQSYEMIPLIGLDKEKDALNALPNERIRRQYKIDTKSVKVNKSSLITYKTRQYSVPSQYINTTLDLQEFDQRIHLYYNKNLITTHDVSTKKMNYHIEDYIDITQKTLPFDDERIETLAKENLRIIGERYE